MSGLRPIGVGVIGASPDRGWGRFAHLPALQALPDYRIAAVSTTGMDSASRTAAMFDVPFATDDAFALIAHPEVDLVAITVKVPNHRAYADAALTLGKHIYCEWPLGHGLAEAEAMAAAAGAVPGVRTAIGLQGRHSPVAQQVRALIDEGYVGRVLATSMIVSAEHMTDVMPQELETLLYPEFGTTMLTVHFGHLTDMLCACLGEVAELSASFSTQRPDVTIQETGRLVKGRATDHVALSGTMASGASLSFHMRGGHSRGPNALWEIHGTEGDLLVTGDHGNMHIFPLTLFGGRGESETLAELPIDARHFWSTPDRIEGPAANVAQVYHRLAQDIRTGSRTVTDFGHAVTRHRLLAAAEASAAQGKRIGYQPWGAL